MLRLGRGQEILLSIHTHGGAISKLQGLLETSGPGGTSVGNLGPMYNAALLLHETHRRNACFVYWHPGKAQILMSNSGGPGSYLTLWHSSKGISCSLILTQPTLHLKETQES